MVNMFRIIFLILMLHRNVLANEGSACLPLKMKLTELNATADKDPATLLDKLTQSDVETWA